MTSNTRTSPLPGIIGIGPYVPRYRLDLNVISRHWGNRQTAGSDTWLKSFPGADEDATTMEIEAAANAVRHASINPANVGAVWLGAESIPYAVKSSAGIVASAIGMGPFITAADIEFAYKTGTEAMRFTALAVSVTSITTIAIRYFNY